MERFFFDIIASNLATYDDEGLCFPNAEAAREEMMSTLPALAQDAAHGDRYDVTANVRNAAGRMIFTATLTLTSQWVAAPVA